MVKEEQSSGPVFSMQVADPTGNPATPATVNTARSKRKWIFVAGILVLIAIIVVALLVSGVLRTASDPIVGAWTVDSTGLQMQFDADGTATLRYPETGYSAVGQWQKIAENKYQLSSATGTKSPLLFYDPMADAMHTDDYSMIFARKG